METDKNKGMEGDLGGCEEQVGSDDDDSCEEMIMKTLDEPIMGSRRVNIVVSHKGLANQLRPLDSTSTTVQIHTPDVNGGPYKRTRNVLKEVTNKLEFRPTIAKASRPILKPTGAQQMKQYKILKRSGEGISRTQQRAPF